jgi:hypothetical protein
MYRRFRNWEMPLDVTNEEEGEEERRLCLILMRLCIISLLEKKLMNIMFCKKKIKILCMQRITQFAKKDINIVHAMDNMFYKRKI